MGRSVFAIVAALVVAAAISTAGATGTPSWRVFDFNSSGHALAPRVSPDSMPATVSCDGTGCTGSFEFTPGIFTALLVTGDDGMTGDLTGGTVSATVTVSGNTGPAFQSQNGDGCASPPT